MTPIKKALLLSLVSHAGIVAILLVITIYYEIPRAFIYTELMIAPQPDLPRTDGRVPVPVQPAAEAVQLPDRPLDILPVTEVPAVSDSSPPVPAAQVLRGETDSLRLQAMRRLALYTMPLPGYLLNPSDSVLLRHRLALYGRPQQYYAGNIGEENISSQLYREQSGVGRLFNVGELLNTALAIVPRWDDKRDASLPRITSPPTKLELNILGSLWNTGPSTQLDLYRRLEGDFAITAEDMDRVLEAMTAKGYVRREKISPEDLMTVATPFGSKSFERNELNLKNPVYSYTDLISRREVLLYLDALLYQLRYQMEESFSPNRVDSLQILSLKEKILLLIESR